QWCYLRCTLPAWRSDTLHVCLTCPYWCSGVVLAIALERPAFTVALINNVDLVAAHGSVLLLPKFAVCRINGETLRIAVAIGPDLRAGARLVSERIVWKCRAVGRDPYDLAEIVVKGLCHIAVGEVLTVRKKKGAI